MISRSLHSGIFIATATFVAGCFTSAYAEPLPRFPAAAVWYQDVSAAPLHPQSISMTEGLFSLGGFGFDRFQIDFSNHVVRAPAGAPVRSIVPRPGYYSPDCDLPASLPVPANAAIEGQSGLSCPEGEDCHLLVVQGNRLYEAYQANESGPNGLQSQCLVVWELDRVYPPPGRGEHCTSADAAGFPIAPLLFNADEVFAAIATTGDLGHAIRFILPNARMASEPGNGGVEGRLYVRPATHAGAPSGPAFSVPYGARLRLRADFPLTNYSPGAQVVLRTLKRYGMVLADGGNIALTAESDLYTDHTWAEVGIGSRVFDQTPSARDVFPSDFQVIDTGARIPETYDCVRTVLPPNDGIIFANDFE